MSFIKLYEFPNGGSVTLEMLPIILFAVRYGCGWGAGAGFVFGTVTYLIGNKFSIDWTTIICDYFLAFTALGFGAGLLARRKWSVFLFQSSAACCVFWPTISSAPWCGASICPMSSSA